MQNSKSENRKSVFTSIFNNIDAPQLNLKSFASALPNIIWIADSNGSMQFCNDYGLQYLGFENSDITDEEWASTVHPDEIKSIAEKWKEALIEKKPFQNIQKQKNKAGDYQWFKATANPIFNEKGEISHWIGISINIDEEIQNRQELEDRNHRLDLSIKNTRSGIWDWDLQKDTIIYNDNWWEMLGYKKGEFEENTSIWERLLHHDDRDQALSKLEKHILGESDFYESVYRLKTKSKKWLWVYDSGRVIDRDANGKALRFIGMQQDYSSRKYQEDFVRNSENKMRILAESAQKLMDFKTVDEIRGHCVNEIYKHIEGKGIVNFTSYEEKDKSWRVLKTKGHSSLIKNLMNIIGRPIENLSGKLDGNFDALMSTGKLLYFEPEIQNMLTDIISEKALNGVKKFIKLDKIYGIGIVKNDSVHGNITIIPKDSKLELDRNFIETIVYQTASALERKEFEEKILLQNEKLSDLNKDLDMVIKGLSHDLKAPINTAKGILQLRNKVNNAELSEELLFNLDKSLNRLDTITDDLLGMVFNNRTSVENSSIDIKSLINQAIEEQENEIAFDEINWLIKIDQNSDFYSDSKRIKLILRNLISNAIKYRDVNKSQKNIEISGSCNIETLRICVKDNGIGMKSDQLEKVFDLFYRANNQQKGIGLGLHIIKQTVHKLDGTIEVNSNFQEGTEIIFTIPNHVK